VAACVIVSYDVVDPEGFAGDVPGVMPLLAKHGAEVLVADTGARAMEGEKRSAYVVLRFASEEAAMGFYNDADYAPIKKIRLDSTANGNLVIAKPFAPPSA
jgi:uncharacterized protein (DUF1330 family)